LYTYASTCDSAPAQVWTVQPQAVQHSVDIFHPHLQQGIPTPDRRLGTPIRKVLATGETHTRAGRAFASPC
jgi:hypothetical protein